MTSQSDLRPRAHILVLGTADWDSPIATNQHYAVRELAKEHLVTFVESIGLRRPSISKADLTRMRSRLVRQASGPEAAPRRRLPEGVDIVSPLIVPMHSSSLVRALNQRLLAGALQGWLATPANRRILWAYTPVTYGFEDSAAGALYHCVDLLSEFPGVDAGSVDRGERELASNGVQAAASSAIVSDHLARQGFNEPLQWPNVADAEVYAADGLRVERTPIVVFGGNITAKKIDFHLLVQLARALVGHGSLVLAGPVSAGGGGVPPQLAQLRKLGVRLVGVKSPHQLADLYRRSAVGIIPYQINSYTTGVSPLKTYEYLAAGLPVVSSPVPAVATRSGHVWVEGERAEFVSRVLSLLGQDPSQACGERRRIALEHSWTGRGREMRAFVSNTLKQAT